MAGFSLVAIRRFSRAAPTSRPKIEKNTIAGKG